MSHDDTAGRDGEWYHRGPCGTCPPCRICGSTECYVWNDNVSPEVHICAKGCDGYPGEVTS